MQADLFATITAAVDHSQEGDAELHQWFTPFWAAEMLLSDALSPLGEVAVIEPSCGNGAFLSAVPAHLHAIGVDIDPEMASQARISSGREVLVGDFREINLPLKHAGLIVGNPPFSMPIIDGFIDRSHEILLDEGVAAFILPSYVFSTSGRVMRWNERFALDIKAIPRSLFGRISMPLVWAKFTKTSRRTLVGFLLFPEQSSVENMSKEVRRRLAGPGTWREAVTHVLETLGGEATLREIYRAIEPRRPTDNRHWKDKIRQTLGLYFRRINAERWAVPV